MILYSQKSRCWLYLIANLYVSSIDRSFSRTPTSNGAGRTGHTGHHRTYLSSTWPLMCNRCWGPQDHAEATAADECSVVELPPIRYQCRWKTFLAFPAYLINPELMQWLWLMKRSAKVLRVANTFLSLDLLDSILLGSTGVVAALVWLRRTIEGGQWHAAKSKPLIGLWLIARR